MKKYIIFDDPKRSEHQSPESDCVSDKSSQSEGKASSTQQHPYPFEAARSAVPTCIIRYGPHHSMAHPPTPPHLLGYTPTPSATVLLNLESRLRRFWQVSVPRQRMPVWTPPLLRGRLCTFSPFRTVSYLGRVENILTSHTRPSCERNPLCCLSLVIYYTSYQPNRDAYGRLICCPPRHAPRTEGSWAEREELKTIDLR
ncbi:hypothetical protein BJV74DRAFT_855115 [Russula compacta]|nr:hypothetical protein BJV74DRAFT_855115 [Russula compacta]